MAVMPSTTAFSSTVDDFAVCSGAGLAWHGQTTSSIATKAASRMRAMVAMSVSHVLQVRAVFVLEASRRLL